MKIINVFKKKKHTVETSKEEISSHIIEGVDRESAQISDNSEKTEIGKEEKPQNQTDSSPAKSKTVHNLIILDESGSMQLIYLPALSGVNETLQTIRNAEKEYESQKHFVSLISFNSENYNEIYNNIPARKAMDISEKHYRPAGCTPLYDAMGRALTGLRKKIKKEDTVLVTVITDGMENASSEYSGPAIKSLVEALKAEGWVFTYIGANQDVEAVANSMSINNHLVFDANPNSTRNMFAKEMRSRKKFFENLDNNMSKEDLGYDYFKE